MRLVIGIQPVREALRAHGSKLRRVLVQQQPSKRLASLLKFAQDTEDVTVEIVPRRVLDSRCKGAHHQGVICEAPPLVMTPLEALLEDSTASLIVLDGITDPHNFGASLRSAVALGSGTVIFGQNHAAPLTPATFRASAGAVEHATLCQVSSLRATIETLNAASFKTVALASGGTEPLGGIDLAGPVALVVGSEDKGVSRGVRRLCSHQARLPMRGSLDSLNASVAAAVALHEVVRQRG